MQLGRIGIDAFKREENPLDWDRTLGIWTNPCTELYDAASNFDKIDAHDHWTMPQVRVGILKAFRVPENLMVNFSLWIPSAEELHRGDQDAREIAGAAAGVAVKELNDEARGVSARIALRGVDEVKRCWEQSFREACDNILNQRSVYSFGHGSFWTLERPSAVDEDLPTGIATWADVT